MLCRIRVTCLYLCFLGHEKRILGVLSFLGAKRSGMKQVEWEGEVVQQPKGIWLPSLSQRVVDLFARQSSIKFKASCDLGVEEDVEFVIGA